MFTSHHMTFANNDVDMFDLIESDIENYKSKGKVFITGDFNDRTSNEIDYITGYRFLNHEANQFSNSVIINRVNKDHVLDTHGRRLIQLCQSSDILIGNGRLCNDKKIGNFTFLSRNGSSVVDYFLLKNDDFVNIDHFDVLLPNEYSDHCTLYISIKRTRQPAEQTNQNKSSELYLKWDESLGQIFRTDLLNNISQIRLLTHNLENHPIGESVQSFIAFMQDFAFKTFGKNREAPTDLSNKRKQNKNWFNTECYEACREFNTARNKYERNRNDNNRNNYISKKQQYNRIKNKCKKQYARKEGLRVSKLAKSDPKKFWQNVNLQSKKKSQNPENITIHDMYTMVSVDNTPTNDTLFDNISDEYLDQNFTEIEVKNAVFSQTNGKSAGSDHLIAEIFKNSFDIIGPFLTALYNTVFNEGCYPESWGKEL